jgi:hypothetical protein
MARAFIRFLSSPRLRGDGQARALSTPGTLAFLTLAR